MYTFQSMYFPVTRAMRQEWPIGPLIYILQAEPLACAIRKNKNIIGLPLPRISSVSMRRDEVKSNAFVDDTQLFNSTEESITECFKTINKYEKASGASIHKHKTIGLYIGPWKEKIPEYNEISWTKDNVKTLGIHHGYNIVENAVWMDKIKKDQKLY